MAEPKKILFVCTGNTCRSAMAAAMMNDIAVKKNLNVLIDSAGVFAEPGDRASEEAVHAMAVRGIDLTEHRAKPLTQEIIDMADVVLTMTEAHKMILAQACGDKVYTLLEYAGGKGDIADPFGGDFEEYNAAADEIYSALVNISHKFEDNPKENA